MRLAISTVSDFKSSSKPNFPCFVGGFNPALTNRFSLPNGVRDHPEIIPCKGIIIAVIPSLMGLESKDLAATACRGYCLVNRAEEYWEAFFTHIKMLTLVFSIVQRP